MDEDQLERLVQSFELIAGAVGDIRDIQKRRYERLYGDRKPPREAVVTRIKNDEDIAKERQGASTEPISKWFGGFEDEGFVGVYEKAFLEEKQRSDASATVSAEQGQGAGGAKAAGSKARRGRKRSANQRSTQGSGGGVEGGPDGDAIQPSERND